MIEHNGQTLAYIGDAVLSLQVREYLVKEKVTHASELMKKSIRFVSATAQAKFMDELLSMDILSETEMRMYKKGRNYKSPSIAKNANVIDYRKASGLESLWGYLYLSEDYERLGLIWDLFKTHVEENDDRIHIREE